MHLHPSAAKTESKACSLPWHGNLYQGERARQKANGPAKNAGPFRATYRMGREVMDVVRTPSSARWETLHSPASGFPVRKSGLALHQGLISRFDYYQGFVTTDSRTPQREPKVILWM